MNAHCSEVKKDGNPCQAPRVTGTDKCFFHSPAMMAERDKAQKKGGATTSARLHNVFQSHLPREAPEMPLESPEDAMALLGKAANWVLRGEILPQIANSVSSLVTAYLRGRELKEVEEKLRALE